MDKSMIMKVRRRCLIDSKEKNLFYLVPGTASVCWSLSIKLSLAPLELGVTCVYRVSAGHEGAPTRGADGVNVVVVEDHPGVGKRVDVRGWNLIRSVKTHIVPAL